MNILAIILFSFSIINKKYQAGLRLRYSWNFLTTGIFFWTSCLLIKSWLTNPIARKSWLTTWCFTNKTSEKERQLTTIQKTELYLQLSTKSQVPGSFQDTSLQFMKLYSVRNLQDLWSAASTSGWTPHFIQGDFSQFWSATSASKLSTSLYSVGLQPEIKKGCVHQRVEHLN